MKPAKRLSEYISFEVDGAMVEREWGAIAQRQIARGDRRSRGLAVAIAATATMALVALWFGMAALRATEDKAVADSSLSKEPRNDLGGAAFINDGTGGPERVVLDDGSEITLSPLSHLRLAVQSERLVNLSLDRGTAHFDVVHVPSRVFTVEADFLTVSDLGTRFSVSRQEVANGERVTVSVDEGQVEVRRRDRHDAGIVLGPGDVYTARRGEAATVTHSVSAATPPSDDALESPISTGAPSTNGNAALPRNKRALSPEARSTPSRGASLQRQEALPPATEKISPPKSPTAEELFRQALDKSRVSDAAGAAELLQRLLTDYPSDARTGIAAFQLGRLRLDALGDAKGALRALDNALSFGARTPFAEEAAARRIEALDWLGDTTRCENARDGFLATHPESAFADDVARRCRR